MIDDVVSDFVTSINMYLNSPDVLRRHRYSESMIERIRQLRNEALLLSGELDSLGVLSGQLIEINEEA